MNKIFILDDDEIDQLIFIKLLTTLLTDVHVVSLHLPKNWPTSLGVLKLNPCL